MRTLQQRMKATAVALVMSSITTSSGGLIAHAQSTSSSPPPTLTGERFSTNGYSSGNNNSNSSQCNPDRSGTFTYSVSGTATGPYNGTFTQTGTVTIDNSGKVTADSANFTIISPQGTVTGTLVPPSLFGNGYCTSQLNDAQAASNYQATIATPSGNYFDQGFSGISLATTPPDNTFLDEPFNSSQAQTTLIVPTSKDQCKDGGWQNYPQFKNQGQCVSFVEHE